MDAMDVAATQWINGLSGSSDILDWLMTAVSTVGVPLLVVSVLLQWWTPPVRSSLRHVLVAAGLSFLLGLGLNDLIALTVHRPMPYEVGVSVLIIPRSPDYAFPSDEATASFAIAAAFLIHGRTRRGFVFLVAAVLVAFSRVYIGDHYVSDVLGGAVTGFLAAWVVWSFYDRGTRLDRCLTRIF